MSADDVKPWVDLLVTLLTGGGLGGILLAVVGWMRAKAEKPHIAPDPTVGPGAMAAIGGMMMGRHTAEALIEGLNAMASSQDRCTLVREKEIRVAQEIADQRHREMRTLNDHLDTLCDRLKNLPGCGA